MLASSIEEAAAYNDYINEMKNVIEIGVGVHVLNTRILNKTHEYM